MTKAEFSKAEADLDNIGIFYGVLETDLTAHRTTPLAEPMVDLALRGIADRMDKITDLYGIMKNNAPAGTDMGPYNDEYRRLIKLSSTLHAGYHGIKATFPPAAAASSSSTSASSSSSTAAAAAPVHIQLPPIQLSTFNGNLQDWLTFRDMFKTTVHDSTHLSKIQKLIQLKSCLTGEAARLIQNLILSDANYDTAWTLLQERYTNNRELLFSLIQRLLNQPKLTTPSGTSLRQLVDTTKECLRSLEKLSVPVDKWDELLLYLVFSKLDPSSKELYEHTLEDTAIPKVETLYKFVESRARALLASNNGGGTQSTRQQRSHPQQPAKTHYVSTGNCKCCDQQHPIFRCPMFQQQTLQQRWEFVTSKKLCQNCLTGGHFKDNCPSTKSCKVCNRKHHSLLHNHSQQGRSGGNQGTTPAAATAQQSSHSHCCNTELVSTGILATARINIHSATESLKAQRSLIDGCSTNTQIRNRTARRLALPLRPVNVPIMGSGNVACGAARYVTTFTFSPWFNPDLSYTVTALVVDKVSGYIPGQQLQRSSWPHLNELQLADPDFDKPGEIDVLLGTDIVWELMDNQRISGSSGTPHGIKTTLGWIVAGPNSHQNPSAVATTHISTADLDYSLQRFFTQEESAADLPCHSKEERACEAHFAATHKRDVTGRFTVKLPFKDPKPELGSSRKQAFRRFLALENKYVKNSASESSQKQWAMYKAFMEEYETLHHMELVPPEELNNKDVYYIPHHAVFKESSTSTKLRVVYDGSCATTSGNSLNDCLMVGPTIQDNIWDIMMRFRRHPIAFTADIRMMYRQIRVDKKDADHQRILWRSDSRQPVLDYRLLTVTYGTASAPYLAIKSLQQLAQDEENRFPLGSKVAMKNFYVDDAASSSPTLEEAKQTVTQLIDLCSAGGFDLRKWTTNSQELLDTIPEDRRETASIVDLTADSTIKTLGILWNPKEDIYSFRLSLPPDQHGMYTKRTILSEIAKIYDPLGWLAPTIIVCKLFMQQLWKSTFGWDDTLPDSLQQTWKDIRNSLQDLQKITIPRCVIPGQPVRTVLIGCSDASIVAISACVYIYSEYGGGATSCHLLTSKTRVAPVKHVTLPRLELNGCKLLSDLLKSTLKCLEQDFDEIRAYTDSTIALHWVTSTPSKWKMYVRRRVQSIQDNVPTATWHHIPGDTNPADCASRGINGSELQQHPLWWNGSPFFSSNINKSNLVPFDETAANQEAAPQVMCHLSAPAPLPELFYKYSTFTKLVRIVALLQRFIFNCRNQPEKRHGFLSVMELTNARNCIIILLQKSYFSSEYKLLSSKEPVHPSSHLLKLQPFLHTDGLIRVGGRIRNANIPFDRKHPILLPKGHVLTDRIIMGHHLRFLHAGPRSTLAMLQQQFWVVNGYNTVKAIVRRCVTCTRLRGHLLQQQMGDLPPPRTNPARPFSKVGVDYAGPFTIKPMVRSKISLKCWLSVFICMATRAVHLEIVSSLSTDCFLAALRRFMSRRGKPTDIYSDQGTNFKGADKVLRDFFSLSTASLIQSSCAADQITWHFNPPGAPHFGGLWEAGVRSIKHHLVRVMGTTVLTYEEMLTLTTQIEGILNSRPIVPASSDPDDLEALTPAHFLIGAPITAPPEPDHGSSNINHLQRWTLLQRLQQTFWRRWSQEFLTRLQQRPKWMKTSPNLQVGQLVMIKEDRLSPLKWKLGRITAVHPGHDGLVRVASVKTADGETRRPVVKLSMLPIQSTDSV